MVIVLRKQHLSLRCISDHCGVGIDAVKRWQNGVKPKQRSSYDGLIELMEKYALPETLKACGVIAAARTELTDEQMARCRVEKL